MADVTTGGSSISSTDDSATGLTQCALLLSTCVTKDAECSACYSTSGEETEYQDCYSDFISDIAAISECDSYAGHMCCSAQVSEYDCLENDSIMNVWNCQLAETHGCSPLYCDGIDGNAEVTRDSMAESSRNGAVGIARSSSAMYSFAVGLATAVGMMI